MIQLLHLVFVLTPGANYVRTCHSINCQWGEFKFANGTKSFADGTNSIAKRTNLNVKTHCTINTAYLSILPFIPRMDFLRIVLYTVQHQYAYINFLVCLFLFNLKGQNTKFPMLRLTKVCSCLVQYILLLYVQQITIGQVRRSGTPNCIKANV